MSAEQKNSLAVIHRPRLLRRSICMFVVIFIAALFLLPDTFTFVARAQSGQGHPKEFTQAENEFRTLLRSGTKYPYERWKTLGGRFLALYKKYPNGDTGAWSLYYIARVLEERGKRYSRQDDLNNAAQYYGQVAERYPRHRLADDGLYHRAELELLDLKDPEQARTDLRALFREYPNGDMISPAEKLWSRLPGNAPLPPKGNVAASSDPADQKKGRPVATAVPGVKTVTALQHESSPGHSNIIISLSEDIPYTYGFIPAQKNKPARLYIDLADTVIAKGVRRNTPLADQAFKRIRAAESQQKGVRVVMEMNANLPYTITKENDPPSLIIDVATPGRASTAGKATAERKTDPPHGDASASLGKTTSRQGQNEKIDPTAKTAVSGGVKPGDLVSQLGLSIKTIMIDPGHGGKDPGAKGLNGMLEKEVNLRMAKALGNALGKQGYNVLYTRTTDTFIRLEKRTAMANDKKVDLFISLHCNAYNNAKMHGFETYYLDQAKSDEAVRVAARENGVSIREISDLQVIITDLMLNSKIKESRTLARTLNKSVVSNLKTRYSIRDHGTKGAPFFVLYGAKMPAVLIEIGYITNGNDSKNMANSAYINDLAAYLARGVNEYRRQVEQLAVR